MVKIAVFCGVARARCDVDKKYAFWWIMYSSARSVFWPPSLIRRDSIGGFFVCFYERRIICIMYSLGGLCIVWVCRWDSVCFLFVGGAVRPVVMNVDGREMPSSGRGVVFFGAWNSGGRGGWQGEKMLVPILDIREKLGYRKWRN